MTGEELSYDYNFDPYSQKNVQECRCGSANCRGVLGPRPREKEQRAKEPTLNTKKANAPRSGAKRKKVLDESASRLNKSHKLHTPRSIKAGIRNAVTKVQSTVSRSATHRGRGPATKETKSTTRQIKTRVPGTTKGRIPDGSNGKVTTHRKLPVTKARARVKTATRTSRAPVSRGTQSKSLPTKLTRPSGGAKARTANGSASRRQLAKEPMIETGSMRKRKNQYTKRTAKPRTTNVRVKTVSRS
ncbi:Histone-lysine N-methyltransferase [Aspergillus sclerotialis]|uniref:Histone-lysine N-methyltransferase n=1 Tax=Aspergillus sclerotialis TaxID=2070753 RepID=A0A3A2ZJB6_9EURO|nr:Histone-lysine N-methyltransferase [Aspergillus sclerotialis]